MRDLKSARGAADMAEKEGDALLGRAMEHHGSPGTWQCRVSGGSARR
jgi:hypothetical protein